MASVADPPPKAATGPGHRFLVAGPAASETLAPTIGVISAAAANCERLEAAAEALERSRFRLKAILDAAGDAYLLVGFERRILDVNGVTLTLSGRGRTECIGHDYRGVIDGEACRSVIEKTFRRRRPVEMETHSGLREGERARLYGLPDEEGVILVSRALPKSRPDSVPAVAADQILAAREEERRRLARELHDSVQQDLAAIGLGLHALGRASSPEAPAALREMKALVRRVQLRIRTCAFLMHPPELRSGDLVSALALLTTGLERRTGVRVRLQAPDQVRLSACQSSALYRIAQEALANVYRHAAARRVVVRLHVGAESAVLDVEDDGVGFDVAHARQMAAGMGLDSMGERAAGCLGQLSVERLPRGTLVRAVIPLDQASSCTAGETAAP